MLENAPGGSRTPENGPRASRLPPLTIGGVPRGNFWPGGPAAQRPPKLQNSLLSDRGVSRGSKPAPRTVERRPAPGRGVRAGGTPPLGAPAPPCMVDRRPYTRNFGVHRGMGSFLEGDPNDLKLITFYKKFVIAIL